MSASPGEQLLNSMKAIANLHGDCIKLFEDLDRALPELKSFYNAVTTDLGSAMSARRYLADGLIRLYHPRDNESEFLSFNIAFYDMNDPLLTEPLLIAARISYEPVPIDQKERAQRIWDPWAAFLSWSPKRVFGEAIVLERPAKRGSIEKITVSASPLMSIRSISEALELVAVVGGPPK